MTAPIDPNAPVQFVGETAANFLARQQQYYIPTSGPNQDSARAWLALCAANTGGSAPTGFLIK